jgi:hypothetical protein
VADREEARLLLLEARFVLDNVLRCFDGDAPPRTLRKDLESGDCKTASLDIGGKDDDDILGLS